MLFQGLSTNSGGKRCRKIGLGIYDMEHKLQPNPDQGVQSLMRSRVFSGIRNANIKRLRAKKSAGALTMKQKLLMLRQLTDQLPVTQKKSANSDKCDIDLQALEASIIRYKYLMDSKR